MICEKCKTEVNDGVTFCPSCGNKIGEAAQPESGTQSTSVQDTFQKLNDTEDTTSQYDAKDIQDNKVMAILAYFGPLVLIPWLAAPNSKFARFHANQGLVMFIVFIAFAIVERIILGILWRVFFLYGLFGLIFTLVYLALVVLEIIGIINAASGKAKELPVFGKIKLLK